MRHYLTGAVRLLILLAAFITQSVYALPAFPGATGFGGETIGGRGGEVIKVTNLNDSGAGSFREAVNTRGPRIIVFEVSGHIFLNSRLTIDEPFVTIAGQTSPGGILITGDDFRINTNDVIMRYMRVRAGPHGCSPGSSGCARIHAMEILGEGWDDNEAYNIIIDHSSFSWGIDETLAISGGVTNITIQDSIIAEGLNDAGHNESNHSYSLLVNDKPNENIFTLTLYRNYFANSNGRNPRIRGQFGAGNKADVVNNIAYGWNSWDGPQGDLDVEMNWVHNHAEPASYSNPNSYGLRTDSGRSASPTLFFEGNIGPRRTSQTEPEWAAEDDDSGNSHNLLNTAWQRLTRWPHPITPVGTMGPALLDEILEDVGASLPVRDSVDTRIVNDFYARTGDVLDTVSYPDDFPTFQNLTPPADIDNDGMSDAWEVTNGFIVGINESAGDADGDGYTNIEEYLHELAGVAREQVNTGSNAVPSTTIIDESDFEVTNRRSI